MVPQSLIIVGPLALVMAVLLPLPRWLLEPLRGSAVATLVVRAGFLVIPGLSFVALQRDLQAFAG